jgi:hypothetical protein
MKCEQPNQDIHHELPIPSRILDLVKKISFLSGARPATSVKLAKFMVSQDNTRTCSKMCQIKILLCNRYLLIKSCEGGKKSSCY